MKYISNNSCKEKKEKEDFSSFEDWSIKEFENFTRKFAIAEGSRQLKAAVELTKITNVLPEYSNTRSQIWKENLLGDFKGQIKAITYKMTSVLLLSHIKRKHYF